MLQVFQFLHITISVLGFFQFIYVNQSFAPSPDQDVGILFDVSTNKYLFQCPVTVIWFVLKANFLSSKADKT